VVGALLLLLSYAVNLGFRFRVMISGNGKDYNAECNRLWLQKVVMLSGRFRLFVPGAL